MGQIVCPRCGQPNADTANACGHCGCFLKPYPMNNISPEAQNYPPQRPTAQNYPPQGQPVYPQGQGYPPQGTFAQNPSAGVKVQSDYISLWKASGNARKSKAFHIVSTVLMIVGFLCILPALLFICMGGSHNLILAGIASFLLYLCPILWALWSVFLCIYQYLQIMNCADWMRREHIAPGIFSLKHADGMSKAIAYYYFMPEKRGYRTFLVVWDSILCFITGMLMCSSLTRFLALGVFDISILIVGAIPQLTASGILFASAFVGNLLGAIPDFVETGRVNSYIKKKRREAEEAAQKNSAQPDAAQQNATQPDVAQPNITQKNTPTY